MGSKTSNLLSGGPTEHWPLVETNGLTLQNDINKLPARSSRCAAISAAVGRYWRVLWIMSPTQHSNTVEDKSIESQSTGPFSSAPRVQEKPRNCPPGGRVELGANVPQQVNGAWTPTTPSKHETAI